MPAPLARMPGYLSFGPSVPGAGPIIHIEDHGLFLIAVRWDAGRSVPWVLRKEADAEWYGMLVH